RAHGRRHVHVSGLSWPRGSLEQDRLRKHGEDRSHGRARRVDARRKLGRAEMERVKSQGRQILEGVEATTFTLSDPLYSRPRSSCKSARANGIHAVEPRCERTPGCAIKRKSYYQIRTRSPGASHSLSPSLTLNTE